VGALLGAGTIDNVTTGTTNTLTVGNNEATGGNFSGAIENTTGNLALTKTGTGTQTLSGTNTYSGKTVVQLGKLVVSGSIGNSAVTVSNTDTVLASGTTGTIGSSVTINNGAILAAGDVDAIGTATVGSGGTTMNTGSIFSWDLDTAGSGYDKVVTSSLAGDSGGASAVFAVVLKSGQSFTDTFWNSGHSWDNIFSTTGLAGGALGMTSVFSSFTYNGSGTAPVSGSFSFTGTGGSTLTWTAVPEPTSALAGLLICAGMFRRRRH
jgi:autotransporter-associated beta strand protein